MRKIISILLLVVIAMLSISGCIADEEDTTSGLHYTDPRYYVITDYEIVGNNVCKLGESVEIKVSMGLDEEVYHTGVYSHHKLRFYDIVENMFVALLIDNIDSTEFEKSYKADESNDMLYESTYEESVNYGQGNLEPLTNKFEYHESFMVSLYNVDLEGSHDPVVSSYILVGTTTFYVPEHQKIAKSLGLRFFPSGSVDNKYDPQYDDEDGSRFIGYRGIELFYATDGEYVAFAKTMEEAHSLIYDISDKLYDQN